MPSAETDVSCQTLVETRAVAMPPDCTIRAIEAARTALCQAMRQGMPAGCILSVDCAAVEQADLTFVQLLASADKTASVRDLRLEVRAVPPCVRQAFGRSGVEPSFFS